MYSLIFDEEAISFLEKQDRIIKERIFSKLREAKTNPLYFFEKLVSRTDYKLRVGDYRIIVDLDHTNKIIKVTFIGHRKNVYSKL